MIRISVIIPTYNRSELLRRVIKGYLEQSLASELFEIIVVNDASTDATEGMLVEEFGDLITIINQAKLGPAHARNLGIEAAQGEFLYFTNDDMLPEIDLLEKHLTAHELYAGQRAILGYVKWAADLEVTPLMHYVTEVGGGQFSYFRIQDPLNVPGRYFYTCNISLHRDWLTRERFATEMVYPILEDVELGYRLEQKGLKLVFVREAVVYHEHQLEMEGFLSRQYKAGCIAVWLAKRYPELKKELGIIRAGEVVIDQDILQTADELRIIIEEKLKSKGDSNLFGLNKLEQALYECYSLLIGASYYQGVQDSV